MTELYRIASGELQVRAGADSSERVIEGIVVPWGQVAEVRDTPGGRPYRETIARGATAGLAPDRVLLEALTTPPRDYNTHDGATLIGRAISAEDRPEGLHMAFRVAATAAGDDTLALARDGVLSGLSIAFRSVSARQRPDGVTERTAVDVRRVAIVAGGAYQGAQVTAVRAAQQEDATMPEGNTAPAGANEETTTEEAPAPPATSSGARPNRTRVTVDVERAQAERAELATLARGGTGLAGAYVTRAELEYGPQTGHHILRDLVHRADNSEAAERYARHQAFLADLAGRIEATGDMARAGDVLSSEIPCAYPNLYAPGLLTPRILKGRPMGGFFRNVPISSGQPVIFPKVTTSTSVAVQSAEGANPAASDFATTAVTATPLLYGGTTDVSRQVIDGASPGALDMILADMLEGYAQASETVIKTAVEAGATASGVAITAATPFAGALANVINYYSVRFKAAGAVFIPSAAYPVLLAEADTTGRPKVPWQGPINSDAAVADGAQSANMLGAQALLSYASTVNVWVFARPDDYAVFESPIVRFSYDQVAGPSAVRIGLWAYLVVGTRLGGLKVTAA